VPGRWASAYGGCFYRPVRIRACGLRRVGLVLGGLVAGVQGQFLTLFTTSARSPVDAFAA